MSVLILASIVGVGVLVLRADAAHVTDRASEAAPGPPPIVPVWIEVKRPIALFGLSGSGFSRLPLSYRARRRLPTGEREDSLTYGQFGDQRPFLDLSVVRRGTRPSESVEFVSEMGRLARGDHLTLKGSVPPTRLQTRFGPFATADLILSDGRATQSCLGFLLDSANGPDPVGIAGVACRSPGFDRAMLACVLDRIDLLSAGEDDELRRFFVDAERHRQTSCSVSPLLAAGSHPVWFDGDAPAPAMRHLIGSRAH